MNRSAKLFDIVIGLFGSVFALVTLLIWIPADIDTGVIDVWRRNVRIGDAMLPTFAALIILGASVVIGVRALLNRASGTPRSMSWVFLISSLAIVVLSLFIMWKAGPLFVGLWFSGEEPYRNFIDTAPWKYTGFVLGGTLMVFAFMTLAGHRLKWRDAAMAFIATVIIALLYDLPFDNLFLPPNGDF